MERISRGRHSRSLARRIRSSPYPLRSCRWEVADEGIPKRTSSLAFERRDWEDATCSVCMEFPHNAVLLLCSSHDKGCRPYMCGTSYRHSNCLDQFKKAYTKIHEGAQALEEHPGNLGLFAEGFGSSGWPSNNRQNSEAIKLAVCPLCRGQVKGWTVVKPARDYLNNKKRSCVQDNCFFSGTYKELHKHVRVEHPCAKPHEVDPMLQHKWMRLEHEREREDVISTIRSSMPRSVVFGDYVIEMANDDLEGSEEEEVMGGDDSDDGFGGISRGSRSVLYFFLREGARLMGFHRDSRGETSTMLGGRDSDTGRAYDDGLPSNAANGGPDDISPTAIGYSSGGDDDYGAAPPPGDDRGLGMLRAEGRRRRRRRSRGRPVIDPN